MSLFNKYSDPQPRLFAIFYAYNKIGTCSYQVIVDEKPDTATCSIFPAPWFTSKKGDELKPHLKITGLESVRTKGNGRLCLQALFECSNRYGCEGRMVVKSAFESAPFYEHCGFQGGVPGEDGVKYFMPTPKNISLLYKDSTPEKKFKLIPLFPPSVQKEQNSVVDKELFERMVNEFQNKRV